MIIIVMIIIIKIIMNVFACAPLVDECVIFSYGLSAASDVVIFS